MKIKNFYYFVLGVLTLQEDIRIASGKAVIVTATDKNVGAQFENYMNCASNHSSSDCLERTGVTSSQIYFSKKKSFLLKCAKKYCSSSMTFLRCVFQVARERATEEVLAIM